MLFNQVIHQIKPNKLSYLSHFSTTTKCQTLKNLKFQKSKENDLRNYIHIKQTRAGTLTETFNSHSNLFTNRYLFTSKELNELVSLKDNNQENFSDIKTIKSESRNKDTLNQRINTINDDSLRLFLKTLHFTGFDNSKMCLSSFRNLSSNQKRELTVYDYNIIISTLKKHTHGELRTPGDVQLKNIYSIIDTMWKLRIPPDLYTYNELISTHIMLLNTEEVRKIVNHLSTYGPFPDTVIYNNIIRMYSRSEGTVSDAREFWNELKSQSSSRPDIKPDVKSYAAIISSEVRAGNWDSVKSLINEMQENKITADIIIRNIILNGLSNSYGLDTVLKETELIEKDGISLDSTSYYIIISTAIKENNMDCVESYMEKSVITNNKLDSNQIGNLKVNPTDLLEIMEKAKMPISTDIYSVLIKKCVKNSKIPDATRIFLHMKEKRIESNIKVYGVWIDSLSKLGRTFITERVYFQMIKEGIRPDIYIFNSLFEGLIRSKDIVKEKKRLIKLWTTEMRKYNVAKTPFFYNTAFSLYSSFEKPMYTLKFTIAGMQDMIKHEMIELETRSFNLLFRSFSQTTSLINSISESNQIDHSDKLDSFLDLIIKSSQKTKFLQPEQILVEDEDSSDYESKHISNSNFVLNQKVRYIYDIAGREIMNWYNIMTKKYAIRPDGYTYMHVLSGLIELSQHEHAWKVYQDLIKSAESDNSLLYYISYKNEQLIPSLMEMFLSTRSPQYVLNVWRDVLQLGLHLDSFTTAIMLRACDMRGHIEAAKQNIWGLIKIEDSYEKNSETGTSPKQPELDFVDTGPGPITAWISAVDNKLMYLFLALLIKYKQINYIMPTLLLWKKSNSLYFTTNPNREAEKDRRLLEEYGDDIEGLDLSKSGGNAGSNYFLTASMVSKIFSSLSSPKVVEQTNKDSLKVLNELASYIEQHYPSAIPV
ncbi:hypothetical protein BB559_001065 [Furculomyces boomerangus]|uniref:Pentacotripeptide-repeat region of PRORP domain-containing protein n=1 Tax=Furculomyces boomerangus TaxID=61424 RepID=A0A2T9Z361_9FUNG|nr:hypothetical protein BB559_001065 [Furculomyces boomerangus]